jgi:hypothetical protein
MRWANSSGSWLVWMAAAADRRASAELVGLVVDADHDALVAEAAGCLGDEGRVRRWRRS